ncbi:MAG TPA: transketolase C-terminal domain-containing protein [Gaiellales bacterium]|nr:transketolase C-terminal domain-containing protein [Gaiellales bacterium]
MSTDLRTAIRDSLASEMRRDERVVLFGEDIAAAGGVFKATPGLAEEFGPERVFDTPISELALAGAAFGCAVTGMRPVVEIMFGDFMALAMDSLINQSAKYWYMSNEQGAAPLVIRCAVGAGVRFGAVHSQTPVTWLQGVPGIKVVAPAFPDDARGLIEAAIRDENPVVVLEHKRLYSVSGEVGTAPIPIGSARIVRHGSDVTIVSTMRGVHDALAAASRLEAAGVDAEVIDLRSLRPLDVATVTESVTRTTRLVAVEEGPKVGGWASGLMGAVAEAALGEIDDLWALTTPDTPIPYSPGLEDAYLPDADAIARSVLTRLSVGGAAV